MVFYFAKWNEEQSSQPQAELIMEAYITVYYRWWCCGLGFEMLRVAVRDEDLQKSKRLTFLSPGKSPQWQSQHEVWGENATLTTSAAKPAPMCSPTQS